ncbi:MAG: cytochrome C [Rhodospirillaceae bacterium BRH_c57]|nr:MAG: cytochrome C [Rhodospirillaceae bacterium BRH_c57]
MGAKRFGGLAATILAMTLAVPAFASDAKDDPLAAYRSGEMYSGYVTGDPSSREIQDDDMMNPSFLWVDKAAELWTTADGTAGKSCADCHGDVESLKGAATKYPTTDAATGKFMNVELKINDCRERQMGAAPFKFESDELLGMTTLVKLQSRGMPMNIDITGPNEKWFKKGEEFYFTSRGQLDLACADCHITNEGMYMRAEKLSQGQPNGFPTYRMKWQKLGSLHRRMRGCNDNIRAEKLKGLGEDYLAVETYISWRASGLPVETPSVRK